MVDIDNTSEFDAKVSAHVPLVSEALTAINLAIPGMEFETVSVHGDDKTGMMTLRLQIKDPTTDNLNKVKSALDGPWSLSIPVRWCEGNTIVARTPLLLK